MFEGLTDKLRGVFKDLRGHGRISESNVEAALKDVRMALLEADVNFKVVKEFVEAVKSKALGQEVLSSLSPAEQFTKIVYDELTAMLGGEASGINYKGRPSVVMLVGLQGSGKTTSTAKLARLIKKTGRSPYVVPADLYRPAAVDQLKKLASDVGVDCFDSAAYKDAKNVCKDAFEYAKAKNYDTLIVDTAGRLHIDEPLMNELKAIKAMLEPSEIMLVADAMTGQDAVNTAKGFDEAVGLTGVVLTKLDGDARGGAALSMRMVTGKPVKFVGVGEKTDGLEVFHPGRMAGRILDMGDILSLVEKAQAEVDEEKAKELERKIKKDAFTLEDFKDQLQSIKKMGSVESLLSMIPGFGAMQKAKGVQIDEKNIVRVEAIVNSMTRKERHNPKLLNASRRIRIAKGSGTTVQDVNRLMKQYEQMREMMKRVKKGGMGAMKNLLSGMRH
ncbi:MAG: signal recognition particle protein [Deltaproteobacteria bacterium]|nr:signal recognition particle protein [Deltaproteobacteria bacterium]